jgi:glycosyltransferase involved in cell wall biosynthesis
VSESGAGLSVPPNDARALADAIRTLASDPARRERLGAAGRATILERFDRRTVAAQIEASLLRAIGR